MYERVFGGPSTLKFTKASCSFVHLAANDLDTFVGNFPEPKRKREANGIASLKSGQAVADKAFSPYFEDEFFFSSFGGVSGFFSLGFPPPLAMIRLL